MMTGVLDDLASLQRLLGDQMPVIGPTVVARSASEIASGVFWLMEPGIGVRRRVCRELALSLTSARWAKKVAEDFQARGFQIPQEITNALQQEARVLKRITDLAITPPTASGTSPVIENEKAESATDATALMLRAVLPTSVPGEYVYRTYSAVTHGEIYGLMNFMAPGVTSDGSTLLHWHLPADVLDSTIQLAIAAFRESYQRINKVMGLGQARGRPVGDKAPEDLQQLAGVLLGAGCAVWAKLGPVSAPQRGYVQPALTLAIIGLAGVGLRLALAAVPAPEDTYLLPVPLRAWLRFLEVLRLVPWEEGALLGVVWLEVLHPSRPWHTAVLSAALVAYLLATHLARI